MSNGIEAVITFDQTDKRIDVIIDQATHCSFLKELASLALKIPFANQSVWLDDELIDNDKNLMVLLDQTSTRQFVITIGTYINPTFEIILPNGSFEVINLNVNIHSRIGNSYTRNIAGFKSKFLIADGREMIQIDPEKTFDYYGIINEDIIKIIMEPEVSGIVRVMVQIMSEIPGANGRRVYNINSTTPLLVLAKRIANEFNAVKVILIGNNKQLDLSQTYDGANLKLINMVHAIIEA